MNYSGQLEAETVYLTVAEYAQHFRISENTVRTRINRNKLQTVRIERDGRELICIPVPLEEIHQAPELEPGGSVQGFHEQSHEPGVNDSEPHSEWLMFMRETVQTIQNYSGQLVELSRENERYKLLTDGTNQQVRALEQQIEQLKEQLFEKEAKIKELQEKLSHKPRGWRFWSFF